MNLFDWVLWKQLNQVHRDFYAAAIALIQPFQQSTLWVGQSDAELPLEFEVLETDADVIVQFALPATVSPQIDIHLTPETLILRGEHLKPIEQQNYLDWEFCAGRFETLLPLPALIYPQTASLERSGQGLRLTLQKSCELRRSFQVQLGDSQPFGWLTDSLPKTPI